MKKKFLLVPLLYVLCGGFAKAADDSLRGLLVHDAPHATTETPFLDAAGQEVRLSDLPADVTVVNFWALWCVACREEMPSLNALDAAYPDDQLDVVTISVGPNDEVAVDAFFEELGLDRLTQHTDARMRFSREMGVIGLPATVIVNKKGEEIARLTGEADWSSDAAIAALDGLMQ